MSESQESSWIASLTEAIRQIVREEIRAALQEEEEAQEADYRPHLVHIEGEPSVTLKFEHEGALYAGEAHPVKGVW